LETADHALLGTGRERGQTKGTRWGRGVLDERREIIGGERWLETGVAPLSPPSGSCGRLRVVEVGRVTGWRRGLAMTHSDLILKD
jgi:hypothetical protein